MGVAAGAAGIRIIDRRTARSRTQAVERQLAALVDACTMAVRGGASVSQAFEVAASEVEEPMASIVARAVSEQRLGASFGSVLDSISSAIGSEDARLFALVMGVPPPEWRERGRSAGGGGGRGPSPCGRPP